MTARDIVYGKLDERDIAQTKAMIEAYLRWIGIDLGFQDIEDELAHFPEKYKEPEGAFFVARDGDEVVGCVGMKPLGDGACEMKRLYVGDDHKGLGIGKRLVEIILAEAKAKGYTRMRLDTLRRMERALGLYRAFGFREIGQYVENPIEDAVFMERPL
jgi:ribosomal protein S18 acetylase RimI-like enzyme